MAEFIIKCPHCNTELQAQDEWCGMEVECPICGKNIIIGNTAQNEDISTKTELQKHIKYALVAFENMALQEAINEFEIALTFENDNIQALYGIMMCNAYMSSPEKSFLENIIFQYKKIDMIIAQRKNNSTSSWSQEYLEERFISDMGNFVINSFKHILSTLSQLREEINKREDINTLNAYMHKIVLPNPEAMRANQAVKTIAPYLAQLQIIRRFIISLTDIDVICKNNEKLLFVKQIFESTLNISEDGEGIIIAYKTICKAYEIKTIINELHCSEQEAEHEYERRHDLPPVTKKINSFVSKFSSLKWLMLSISAFLAAPVLFGVIILSAKAKIHLPSPFFLMPSVFIIAAIFLFLIFLKAMQLEKTNGIQFPIYNKIKAHWQQVILTIAWIIFVTHGFLNKTPLHIFVIMANIPYYVNRDEAS